MDINSVQTFASFVFGAVGGGAGAFFSSYLKTKGKNVATREDLNKLVEQVAAVTTTTKEIEAKISNEMWDRQKRWEFKKEAIFEVLKAAGSLHTSIGELHSTYASSMDETAADRKHRLEAYSAFSRVHSDFTRAAGVANVVVSKQVSDCLAKLQRTAVLLTRAADKDDLDDSWAKLEEYTHALHTLQAAVRVDLGIDPP